MVSPAGPVYQAGTLSGNPIAVTAGIETLKILQEDTAIYQRLEEKAALLEQAVKETAKETVCVNRTGSLMSIFFTAKKVSDYATAASSDTKRYAEYFAWLLEHGIYTAPSQFEAMFLSDAHTKEDIDKTCEVISKYFEQR